MNRKGGKEKKLKEIIKILERRKGNGQRIKKMKKRINKKQRKRKKKSLNMRNQKAQWIDLVMKVRLKI